MSLDQEVPCTDLVGVGRTAEVVVGEVPSGEVLSAEADSAEVEEWVAEGDLQEVGELV